MILCNAFSDDQTLAFQGLQCQPGNHPPRGGALLPVPVLVPERRSNSTSNAATPVVTNPSGAVPPLPTSGAVFLLRPGRAGSHSEPRCQRNAPAVAFRGGTADKKTDSNDLESQARAEPNCSKKAHAKSRLFEELDNGPKPIRTLGLPRRRALRLGGEGHQATLVQGRHMTSGTSGVDDTIGVFTFSGGACVVCERGPLAPFLRIEAQDYLRCPDCAATVLDAPHRLSRDDEHAHYLHHENAPDDPRYRAFLSKLAGPLIARLGAPASGLDYGCGPGPALAAMLREAGHEVALFDPFFAPDPAPLDVTYDFVTCTEVAEHFHAPAVEFARLRALVRPGGWLALMTSFQTEDARFAGWRYRQDPTHVVFYREQTFRHLAELWGWECEIPAKDVVLMRRPGKGPA